MFRATFQNTIKTLMRSRIFWIAFVALVIVTIPTVWERPDFAEGFEHLAPTSLGIGEYYQHTGNLFHASFLTYSFPIFAVISTVLVLNRDYSDQFYEVEKAAGVMPGRYIAGRLFAVISLQMVAVVLWGGILLHAYVIGWGGVNEMTLGTYIIDSTARLFRWTLAAALPCILVCVGITYFIGSLFKSGLSAAIGGLSIVILYQWLLIFYTRLVLFKGSKLAIAYFHYLSYRPYKLTDYLFSVETGGHGIMVDTSLGEALLCIGIQLGFFAVFSGISYLLLRKREM